MLYYNFFETATAREFRREKRAVMLFDLVNEGVSFEDAAQ